jgi:hypothetical protein
MDAKNLHFPLYTAYYSNVFVLRMDIRLNGLPLNFSSDGQLVLCGQPAESVPLSMDLVAGKMHEYLGRSGHGLVNRVMCGDGAPLFELNTVQSFNMFSLKKLIAQIPKMDKHFETEFKAFLPASMAEGETECEVMTQLYLMCPDTVKKDVKIILVNNENVVLCLDLWKKSSIFDFDYASQIMLKDGTLCALGAKKAVTLQQAVEELDSVVDWFHFGLHLRVPTTVLNRIRADHQNADMCKTQVLMEWMKMQEGSWLHIVQALIGIKMKALAMEIAGKYGI